MIGMSASCVPEAGSKAIGSRVVVVGALEIPKVKEMMLLVVRKDSHVFCWADWMPSPAVGSPSERKYATFLHTLQQFRLRWQWEIDDFIEKERPTYCELEISHFPLLSPCKSPFLMAKQLTL